MHNPLEDPVPEDTIQRVHAFSRDLAYGVIQNWWPPEFIGQLRGAWASWIRQDPKFSSLVSKWHDVWPHPSLLVAFGYLEVASQPLIRDDPDGVRPLYSPPPTISYRLTMRAFSLLERPSPTSIFISYRRRESSALALLILARFKAVGLEPFLDMSIQPGDDWHAQLESEVADREYFVSLIGPTTLESAYVRKEILWAIESNAQIIPVWHNGFGETELTGFQQQYPELEPFLIKQAIPVEQENPVAYEAAIIQLFNRFGFTPA